MSDRQEESFTCPYCGAECASDARKCPDCGAPVVAPARATPEETKRCPMCGEFIFAQAKKCRYCGEILVADRPAPPPVARVAPIPVAVAQTSGEAADLHARRPPKLLVGKGLLLFGAFSFLVNDFNHASNRDLMVVMAFFVGVPAAALTATSVAAHRGSRRGFWSFYALSVGVFLLLGALYTGIKGGH